MPNPLQITDPNADNPLAQAPSWADAYGSVTGSTQNPISDLDHWLAAQRAKSAKMGLWNDQTGLPTGRGLVSAAQQTGNALLMGTTAPGIRAFHGSPYDFERFDTSKIGTGEGNQAYGYGLYFADKPGVAETYKGVAAENAMYAIDNLLSRNRGMRLRPEEITQRLQGTAAAHIADNPDAINAIQKLLPDYLPNAPVMGADLQHYRKLDDLVNTNPGKMYEVNIGADPEHFLHWDRPLSEQSPQVQATLAKVHAEDPEAWARIVKANPKGSDLLESAGLSAEDQARRLNAAGIPGIRYLDQGSRGAQPPIKLVGGKPYDPADPAHLASHALDMANGDRAGAATIADRHAQLRASEGDTTGADAMRQAAALLQSPRQIPALTEGQPPGTHNYVVFDAATIDILRKYGLAGLGVGLGGAAAGTQTYPQQ